MKKIILISLLILPFLALAGTTKKAEFKVSGNCGMCKSRIEAAAKGDGVTSATWSQETKMLAIEYNESKVKLDDIHKRIAKAGHDTDKVKADNDTYNNLPGCCKYERTTSTTGQAPKSGGCCSKQ
jgi:periplasmic mercuric ion binding protein